MVVESSNLLPTPVFWNQRLRRETHARSLSLKDLLVKSLRTNELRDPFPFDCAQGHARQTRQVKLSKSRKVGLGWSNCPNQISIVGRDGVLSQWISSSGGDEKSQNQEGGGDSKNTL